MYNNTLFSKIFVISFLCISFHNAYGMTLASTAKKKAAATKAKLDQKLKDGLKYPGNIEDIDEFEVEINNLIETMYTNLRKVKTSAKMAIQEKKKYEERLQEVIDNYNSYLQ